MYKVDGLFCTLYECIRHSGLDLEDGQAQLVGGCCGHVRTSSSNREHVAVQRDLPGYEDCDRSTARGNLILEWNLKKGLRCFKFLAY